MANDDDRSWVKAGASLSTEEVRRHYDDWAAEYDATLRDWDYRAPEDAAGLLIPLIPADAHVLDAGCGTGLSGDILRRAGLTGRLDGCDLSEESVEIARGRGVYDTVRVANCNALPLPYDTDAFDATTCIGVLTYIDDVPGLLAEFRRVTRAGGIVHATHREDLARTHDFPGTLRALAGRGLCTVVEITAPMPYLPGNPDFADEIGVVHGVLRVR